MRRGSGWNRGEWLPCVWPLILLLCGAVNADAQTVEQAPGPAHATLSTQPGHYRSLNRVLTSGGGFENSQIIRPSDAITPSYEGFTPIGETHAKLLDDGACDCSVSYELECDEPWRACPDILGFCAYGWLQLGITENDRSPPSRYNGVQGLNDRDELMANQLYLVLDRGVDRSGLGWSFGGRIDMLFGNDFVVTEQIGWERTEDNQAKWNNHRHYGFTTPQAYVEAAHGGFSVKAGRFHTLLGYESVMAPDNFFYSHAYGFTHGSPFTHTGLLSTVAFNEWFTVSGGLVNGWDRFDGLTDQTGLITSWYAAPRRANYTFSGAIIADKELAPLSGTRESRFLISMLLTIDCNEYFQVALAHELGTHNSGGPAPGLDAEWYGLTHYMYYRWNDCWTLGSRIDWFRDDDGSRVRGIRPDNPVGLGLVGSFYSASIGANWAPNGNFRVRPELRWDWFDGAGNPYDDGTQDEQFTAAVDAIIRW